MKYFCKYFCTESIKFAFYISTLIEICSISKEIIARAFVGRPKSTNANRQVGDFSPRRSQRRPWKLGMGRFDDESFRNES